MGEIKEFEDLVVWQKSHELVLNGYKATRQFPNEEKVGLISQIRRSAASVAANIVEGSKRQCFLSAELKILNVKWTDKIAFKLRRSEVEGMRCGHTET